MSVDKMYTAGDSTNIAIVGAGTIGLSFAALHLSLPDNRVVIYDPRSDLRAYVEDTLPG